MLPKNLTTAECLPLAGRIGCIPIYSTKPQISYSNTGMELVKQGIIRYMCLYPHSSMMLRICFVNPPSVEAVIGMLKSLDRDKEFSSFGAVGIDLTVFRTKEAPASWVELEDKSLNDGMLGKIKGKRNGSFNLSIINQELSYEDVIKRLSREQHFLVIFDPNEKTVETARNSRNVHIHPLCVPKVYEYKKLSGRVDIRPANEGELFADYANIVEKLYNQPSAFGHRNVFDRSPITEETYKQLLNKTDWLMLLDQSLKSWDICLRSTSEKLYYKGYDYRSAGIYSKNSKKFVMGYKDIIAGCGNYIPNEKGVQDIIDAVRAINEDGLLSIVSHSANQIFDLRHGKGSLGLAIAAIKYKTRYPNSILVGLDTQLAREWLSDREDGKLPDLIGLRLDDEYEPSIDIIEVKTYAEGAYKVEGNLISGHAVEQAAILEELLKEIFGSAERITTVSRREILREQVFENVFSSNYDPDRKQELSEWLNRLFAGELIQATFIREVKNRFICEIELDRQIIECYVPSSCRLSNFFELTGKPVLITPTISQGVRTKYALVAIPYKQSYLLLNSSLANRAIEGAIKSKRFSFLGKRTQILKEHRVEGYKADLFVDDSKTIIEVKSIISTNKSAVFPTVYSERAIKQLNVLRALLEGGYRACYIIVLLNPYVKEIVIDKNACFFHPFTECLNMGMTIKGFTCRLKNGYIVLEKEICITIEPEE